MKLNHPKTIKHEKLCIGDIQFSIVHHLPDHFPKVKPDYQPFACQKYTDEVHIDSFYKPSPNVMLSPETKIFDSQTSWSLYRYNKVDYFIQREPGIKNSPPFLTARFYNHFLDCHVYRQIDDCDFSLTDNRSPHPLDYPLGEILTINLLAKNRGVMFHACGVNNQDDGYLFAGNSTHGKSTMAKLWQRHGIILNDDRIIVRKKNDQFWMYGTPWHGEYPGISSNSVPLTKIFILKHGEYNRCLELKPPEAVSMLLARCFPPIWDKQGMDFTLTFCSELISKVQCVLLTFRPDSKVVDFVQQIKYS